MGPVGSLAPGEAARLDTSPAIAVFCTDDGELYAIDDTCTHQDASLVDGRLEGCAVERPLHASTFNLPPGLSHPAQSVETRSPTRSPVEPAWRGR